MIVEDVNTSCHKGQFNWAEYQQGNRRLEQHTVKPSRPNIPVANFTQQQQNTWNDLQGGQVYIKQVLVNFKK